MAQQSKQLRRFNRLVGETDAVYARSGENAMLCARDGETVYMIIAQADEQTLYALGVDAETK